MGQYTGGGRFVTKGWRFADFGVKFIKSFYFYDIIYFTSNIYIYISIIRCVFGHGSVSKSFNHWFLRYEPVFLGWASCLMLPYSYRWLDCLFNIFSVWHLSKHPSSALQTLYAENRSTRKWPVTWKLSCIDIIMAGPVKLETSGYLER